MLTKDIAADINNFVHGMVKGPSAVFAALFAISSGFHSWQSMYVHSGVP
jgi:hypothetical protein